MGPWCGVLRIALRRSVAQRHHPVRDRQPYLGASAQLPVADSKVMLGSTARRITYRLTPTMTTERLSQVSLLREVREVGWRNGNSARQHS